MIKRFTFLKIFVILRHKISAFLERVNVILLFFLVLLGITLTSFFSFRIDSQTFSHDSDLAAMELHHFMLNRFNENNIDLVVRGSSIRQFEDRELYTDFIADKLNEDGIIEHLEGKDVVHVGSEYDFTNGVIYEKFSDKSLQDSNLASKKDSKKDSNRDSNQNSANIKFFSQKGVYNMAFEIFTGRGDFSIEDPSMRTHGKDIFYDKNTDTITAKYIKTQILR